MAGAKSVSLSALAAHRAEGTLHDTAREPYKPWHRYKRQFDVGSRWTSEYLYSPYQLLLIPVLQEVKGYLRGTTKRDPLRVWWRLVLPAHMRRRVGDAVRQILELLIPLSLLEARYSPTIPNITRSSPRGSVWAAERGGNFYQQHFTYCQQ